MDKFYMKISLLQPVFLLFHWYINHFLLLLCSISWALNSFRTCPFFCSWLSLVDAAMMISWYEWNKELLSKQWLWYSYIAVVTIALPNAVVKGYLLSLSSCHRLATHRSRMCVVLLFDKKIGIHARIVRASLGPPIGVEMYYQRTAAFEFSEFPAKPRPGSGRE